MSRVRTVLGMVKAASPTPMFVPKPSALRAHTTRGPAPDADDEHTRHGHDVTRSGQRSFRDTLDNPFGYPDSVLDVRHFEMKTNGSIDNLQADAGR
ncbi:hypothetical protein J6590_058583 [Homalodisca vitripennis]|nr:hypothetical protein J6590_058583 [Homalodisca vitripennis]